ncbi:MAG: amino acid adenylation domain-containing protein [Lachnospiraceae bacterium]|nr:amino acid adenylation domain-containing protein [Lachnospiraceae bacterium]
MINVLQMLQRSASLYPDAEAFRDPASSVTFSELKSRSERIGTYLLRGGVTDGDGIAFFMEKCVDVLPVMFGSVYANAFYSFIDIRQPKERTLSIVRTLSPAFLITDEANEGQLPDELKEYPSVKILRIEDLKDLSERGDLDEDLLQSASGRFFDLLPLYVNFTSGSTGVPKGVAVSHRSVIDFIETFTGTFGITSEDVLANQAPFDFDVSVKDIYSGLYTGASVALIPREYFSNPTLLMDYLCEVNATVLIWAVSAMCFVTIMNALDYKVPEKLRIIMFSGEVMPIKQLNKWKKYLPDATYVNLYGPTEITCNCTYHILNREYEPGETIPIGIPFPNEKVFLLDADDRLITGPDTEGEICVAGTCLALGYFKAPAKTDDVFTQNPVNEKFYERIYRTGDLGKYNEELELIYIGRKDFQVKHMGQRIELGDIESAAMALEGIERACCLYDSVHKKIILFYTGPLEKELIPDRIREKLPPFMIPNKTIRLNVFPMTKNGKIDRVALLEHIRKQP